MRRLISQWRFVTTRGDKTWAALFGLATAYQATMLALNPTLDSAITLFATIMFASVMMNADYHRGHRTKYQSITNFGATVSNHLHTYGDLLIEKRDGDNYKITPLTSGAENEPQAT